MRIKFAILAEGAGFVAGGIEGSTASWSIEPTRSTTLLAIGEIALSELHVTDLLSARGVSLHNATAAYRCHSGWDIASDKFPRGPSGSEAANNNSHWAASPILGRIDAIRVFLFQHSAICMGH